MFCNFDNYDEEICNRKTKTEVIKKYGEFDSTYFYNQDVEGVCISGVYEVEEPLFWQMVVMVFK